VLLIVLLITGKELRYRGWIVMLRETSEGEDFRKAMEKVLGQKNAKGTGRIVRNCGWLVKYTMWE
jgi:hypothetical protein